MYRVGRAGHWTYSRDVLDKCKTSGGKIHIPENIRIFIDMEKFLFYSRYKNSGKTFMEQIKSQHMKTRNQYDYDNNSNSSNEMIPI